MNHCSNINLAHSKATGNRSAAVVRELECGVVQRVPTLPGGSVRGHERCVDGAARVRGATEGAHAGQKATRGRDSVVGVKHRLRRRR